MSSLTKKLFARIGFVFLFAQILPAGDVPAASNGAFDASPITDTVLLVKISEGVIDYARYYDPVPASAFHYALLDTNRAAQTSVYTLESLDDPAYGATGVHPLAVGRKAKGQYFSPDLYVYKSNLPSYLSEHSLYLQFPTPLQPGCTYTLRAEGLVANGETSSFRFDASALVSETIHLNQLGFRPTSPKFAYLSQFMGDFDSAPHLQGALDLADYAGSAFRIVNADNGQLVFTGILSLQKAKNLVDVNNADFGLSRNMSHADVWQADFSALQTPGRYRLVVERMGCSHPFTIEADVYRDAYIAAMRGLFFQRSGIEKEVREWGGIVYPADYATNAMYYLPTAGREESGSVADTSRPVTGIWGWYHDAGDWDGYARHSAVPATLLLAYEMTPGKFGDGDIGNRWRRYSEDPWFDEGTNGIPDMLDEAGWLLDCYRRARHALMDQGYGTGGVPAYFGVDGCGNVNASWLDARVLGIHGEDAKLTAEYAGLAAWNSALLAEAGRPAAEVDLWLAEAREAYQWATQHDGMSGEEGVLAHAGLYRATGDAQYQNAFLASFNSGANWEYWGSASARHFALFLYALLPPTHPGLDATRHLELQNLVANTANAFWLNSGFTRGFRATHLAGYQRIFLGALSTPRTLFPAVAYAVKGEQGYADGVQFAADYTLGGNQMSRVWISGVGWRTEGDVFHPDSWALPVAPGSERNIRPCLPGLTPFGAHATFDWFGANYNFSGSEDFSRSSAYPVIWRKTGTSYNGWGPAWNSAANIPSWASADSLGGGPKNNTLFPPGEQRFPNRFSIPGSEFTVNQTLCHSAFTYALLIDGFRKLDETLYFRNSLLLLN